MAGVPTFISDGPCAVGRTIVDDQKIVSAVANGHGDLSDVFRFVVRWNDDKNAHTKVLHVSCIGALSDSLERPLVGCELVGRQLAQSKQIFFRLFAI